MGVANPISLAEISSYIVLYGSPSVPMDVFEVLIGIMDSKFLDLCNGDKSTSQR